MKLYPKRGFEFSAEGCTGLWCPVLTGNTGYQVLDSNLTTDNHGNAVGYANPSQPWRGSERGTILDFDGTNDNVILTPNRAIYAMPFSVSVWALARNVTQNLVVFSVGSSTNATPLFIVAFRGDSSGDPIQIQMRGSNGVNSVCNGSGFVANRFYHIVGVFASETSRTVYVDGVQGQTDTTSHTATTLDRVTIGALVRTTSGQFLNGQVAEICVVGRALTPLETRRLYDVGPGGAWQFEPRRRSSYFAELLQLPNRRRSSRFLGFPG